MADVSRVERVIRDVYAARVSGDVDGIMRYCGERISFSIAGSPAASPVPLDVCGAGPVREALDRLIGAFAFSDPEIINIITEGNDAAVHWRVRVRSSQSGEEAVTELVDIVRIEGDKLVSYKQFADTALAARLLGR